MSTVNVSPLQSSRINSSGSDDVSFYGVGTLDIVGTQQNPISVTLSQVAGAGLVDTIDLTYANVTLNGVAGVSAIVNYNIQTGGTLNIVSSIGIAAGTTFNFTGVRSHLVFGNGVSVSLLGAINGFGPGSNIDVAPASVSYSYTDNPGSNTGGTITLFNGSGSTVQTVALNTGDFTTSSFYVHPDGTGGTLIDFATKVSSISATPSTADLTVGGNVVLQLGTTGPVIITGGPPTLTLNDGGIATYDAASSTPTLLAFKYTVQPNQNIADLAVTGTNLNGASVTDLVGDAVNLSGGPTNPAGILQIDTTAPTVTGVMTSPGSGSLNAGHIVAFNVTPSEAVTVAGGPPTLTLNDGGTATYDASSSTSTLLVFKYTVQPNQNTADLAVTGTNLNGGTITDGAGNAADLSGAVGNPPGTLQIDTRAPTVASVTTSPSSGSLNAGHLVAFNVTPSEAVTVAGGPPTLTLNDGGVATYDAASSTPTMLVFKYTVQPNQNTADLAVTGTNLNGATITDPAGNAANLSGAIGNPPGTLQIDTTAPTIASVTTSPGSGSFAAGQVVAFNVTPSEAVTVVGGTPTLTLNDGGTATYDAASSTPTMLVFKYTVQPNQNTADLTVTATNLNGATITDPAGNAADLSGAIGNPPGTLRIDTTQPAVTSVYGIAATPATGDLTVGGNVALQITLTGAATVVGAPTLTLNDGGTATYDAATSSSTVLNFLYTVQANQNTADLAVTAISLNGGRVTDTSSNPVDLSGAVANPGGILQIDTTAPTIASVTTSPGSGSLNAGQVVAFNVTPSEAVTVAGGTPTLTLNDGGVATYDAASSTPTMLVFKYTVQPNQNTADLTVTATNLNGATITDGAGNAADLSGAVGNPPGTLQIDTTAPTIGSVTTSPGSGSLAAGQVVAFNVTPSKAVTVAGGPPTLTLNDGGTATYDAASSTPTMLVFKYTVQPNQNTADLAVTGTNLNGGTITDGAGNAADLSGAIGNPPGTLQIDTTAPTVTSVMTSPGSGSLAAGQVVAFTVTPSETVTVAGGPPTLTLNDGGIATYDAASSTPTMLVFKYTVQPNQNTADLTVTGTNLNGATITDPAGNAADLSGAVGNPPGTLQIDTTAPTIASVATSPGSGSLNAGQVVAFNVTPSEAVTVAGGTPTLTLNDGGTATYDAASSTPTMLVFKYTVQPNQNTADLAVTGTNLNGAIITDPAGNAANLSGAIGNPPGTLQIDTTAPTIASVTTSPGSGSLAAGQVVAFNVTPSEAVTVAGGTPTLTLNDGGTATYDAADSTPTMLVFKYVVQPNQNTADLTVTATNLNGATITDPAGNAADLSGAIGNPPGTLRIDTTQPAVTSVYGIAATPATGDLTVGGNVALQITLTGAATVVGAPTLTLNDGGTATYDAATSSSTVLNFLYTVQANQNTADLAVTAISLNGGRVTDTSSNPVDLSGAVANPGGILQIDTTAPTIASVTTSPGSGSLNAGQVVAFNVTPSEAVTVAGGTPTLTLNDGGVATYDAASSTPTMLVFKYTVQPNQNTADLTVTATNLNGATITDGAGNAADLSGAVGNPPGTLQIDTTIPTVTAVGSQPGSGTVAAGQVVTIDVIPSEAITVSGGTPTLTLDDGGTAIYDAANSTPTLMVFTYTVQPGQNTANLTVTGANLNGASISDAAGNPLNLSGATGSLPGVLQVDTPAVVTSVVATPATADLKAGGTIVLQVNTNEPVTVTNGTPTLALSDGGTAVYDAASSTPTMLVFRNTVQSGENTPDLTVTAAFLNGASITDDSGQALDLAGAVGNPDGTLEIDTIRPTAISIIEGGSLQPGGVYTLTVTFSEVVILSGDGIPSFNLSNGGIAYRDSALATPTSAVFEYTVQPGDNTDGGVTISGLNTAGTILADRAGNPIDPTSFGKIIAAAQGNKFDVTGGMGAGTIDVYRFFDTKTGTHFYTQDQAERANVLQMRPDLVPEGPNGVGLTAVDPASNDPNAVAVFRFFDVKLGTHFFTASTTERDSIIATRKDMVYEPSSSFYEHAQQQAGDTAVYRFFDSTYGTHFYTDDLKERASIIQNRPDLVQEGIGFYEPAKNVAL